MNLRVDGFDFDRTDAAKALSAHPTLLRLFLFLLVCFVAMIVTSLAFAVIIKRVFVTNNKSTKQMSPRSKFLEAASRRGFFKTTYFLDLPYGSPFANSLIRNSYDVVEFENTEQTLILTK
jgi:hypothetical protein